MRINEEGGILVMRIKKEVRKIVASVLAFLMVVSLIPVNSLMTKANAA